MPIETLADLHQLLDRAGDISPAGHVHLRIDVGGGFATAITFFVIGYNAASQEVKCLFYDSEDSDIRPERMPLTRLEAYWTDSRLPAEEDDFGIAPRFVVPARPLPMNVAVVRYFLSDIEWSVLDIADEDGASVDTDEFFFESPTAEVAHWCELVARYHQQASTLLDALRDSGP